MVVVNDEVGDVHPSRTRSDDGFGAAAAEAADNMNLEGHSDMANLALAECA